MVVGVLRLELILHAPQSLKEKRGMVKKLLGRLRVRYPVSAAETGHQDFWQKAELGFALVGNEEGTCHRVFDRIEEEILSSGLADVSERWIEFIHY